MPALGPSEAAPSENWGTIWVPASWFNSFEHWGEGPEWTTTVNTVSKVWYQHQIDVPASWKGRRVLVDIRRVSTDAYVSVDGTPCGEVAWPYGQVDITKAVTPGKKAQLCVLVTASTTPGEHVLPMGPAEVQMTKVQNKLSNAGLIGEVFLLSEPQGPVVTDVFVQPSVRKKQVALEIEVTGMTQEATVPFTATMINAVGRDEQVFHGSLPLKAVPAQQATVTFPWEHPALWSPEHPTLYTVRVDVEGSGLKDSYPQRFGFREFWVDGKKFLLNGQEIRLRPTVLTNDAPVTVAGMDGYIDAIRKAGFNIIEQQPINLEERGSSSQNREVWSERADEKGFLSIADGVDFSSYLLKDKTITWWDPGMRERYQARFEVDSRRYRNCPSVVMWTTTPNRYGQFQDQNPRTIGVREIEFPLHDFQMQDLHNKAGLDALNVIRTVDPTRPVYSHAGDMVGDVYTVNQYLDLTPLQEREEWLSNYAQKGDMPYMAVEFGLPLAEATFQRGRNGYGNTTGTEPEVTEYSSIYLGPEAYRLEPDEYRDGIVSKFDGKRFWVSFHNSPLINQQPALQQVVALFIRNTWRAWRTAGLTGGMVPWGLVTQVFAPDKWSGANNPPFVPGLRGAYRKGEEKAGHYLDTSKGWKKTPSSDALVEVNGPTLAWIAGAPANFYEKAHSFRTGQRVEKQVCLINDLPDAAHYHLTWRATADGKTLHEENRDGEIASATNVLLPISFSAPAAVNAEKADGEIVLEATIGDRTSSDKFPFCVFPADVEPLPKVCVYDPVGKTGTLLKSLGVDTVPWDNEAVRGDRVVLVVGRTALSGSNVPFAALDKFATDGGHVLVMSQESDWMHKVAGFRMNRQVSRRFFPVMTDHPVTRGLTARDLQDWAGSGTLIEDRPTYDLHAFVDYSWHWGNQGSLSCAAVEKPHLSGWTPVLEGEFDLAYSPLMQLADGKGTITLCTLDLEDQAGADPVAELLTRRLLRQVAAWHPAARRKTVLLGSDDDANLLKDLGLNFDREDALPSPNALAVIGAGAKVTAAELTAFATEGGNVLVLAANSGRNILGTSVADQSGFYGVTAFESSASGPFAGLSVSDLHFKAPTSWPVLAGDSSAQAGGLLSVRTAGAGMIIEEQLEPRRLNAEKLPYFRFTRWRQTRALSQIITNLGGTFAADENLFHPNAKQSLYHPDYNPHVWDGDDPGRYYRW